MPAFNVTVEDEATFLLNAKRLLALEEDDHTDDDELKRYFSEGCDPMNAAAHYLLRRGKCK